MKVLHLIPSLDIGGAQRLVHDLSIEQISKGIDVTILVYNICGSVIENDLLSKGVKLHSLNIKNRFSIKIPFKLRKIITQFDVIHCHLFPALYHLALSSRCSEVCTLYTEHSTHNRRRDIKWLRVIEKWIYGRYDAIVTLNDGTGQSLKKWLYPCKRVNFAIIGNGIDTKSFRLNPEDFFYPFCSKGIPILMVSRFTKAKDQSCLIKAISIIKNPNVFVIFAGDGPTINDCKALAKEMGVENRCLFLGNRTDIACLINKCHICVQSSNWEGFSLTALEGMAAGKPVIASNVDGMRELVLGAGLLFEAGNFNELANDIELLLSDETLYRTTAISCLNRAHEYDISKAAYKYINLYKQLLYKKSLY